MNSTQSDNLIRILKEADDERHGYNWTVSQILKLINEAREDTLFNITKELRKLQGIKVKDIPMVAKYDVEATLEIYGENLELKEEK